MTEYFNYVFNNPAFFLIIFGFILNFLTKKILSANAIIYAIVGIIILYYKSTFGQLNSVQIFHIEINNMVINDNNLFFGYMFLIVLLCIILFLITTKSLTSKLASGLFISAGGTLGIIFAGDYLSLFFMMEIILIGSIFIMISSNIHHKTIVKYLTTHSAASILIICGIAEISSFQGNFLLDNMSNDIINIFEYDRISIAKMLICVGLIINIGVFPFAHILVNSYSEVSSAATLCLASFSTKAVLLILTNLFGGYILLKYIGIAMVAYGLILSLFENKIRRILLLNMISQFGIICYLLSIENSNEVKSLSYIIICNHILYNMVMLMAAHIILVKFKTENINMIKGIRHNLKKLFICVVTASFSSLSLPFSFGYIAKNLLFLKISQDDVFITIVSLVNIIVILNLGIRFIIRSFMGRRYFSKNRDISNNTFIIMIIIAIFSAFGGNLIINNAFTNINIAEISYSFQDIIKIPIYWCLAALIFVIFFVILKIDQHTYTNFFKFKYRLNLNQINYNLDLPTGMLKTNIFVNDMSVKLAIFILIFSFIIYKI
jgi:multicomponent Na+:H+ antiporter subunit D